MMRIGVIQRAKQLLLKFCEGTQPQFVQGSKPQFVQGPKCQFVPGPKLNLCRDLNLNLCRDLTSSLVFPQPDEVVKIVPTSTAIRSLCFVRYDCCSRFLRKAKEEGWQLNYTVKIMIILNWFDSNIDQLSDEFKKLPSKNDHDCENDPLDMTINFIIIIIMIDCQYEIAQMDMWPSTEEAARSARGVPTAASPLQQEAILTIMIRPGPCPL